MTACPVCGQEVPPVKGLELHDGNAVFSTQGVVRLGAIQTSIIRILLAGPATVQQLVERIYASAPDQPEHPGKSIHVTIAHLRRRLGTIGWGIDNAAGPGSGGAYVLRENDE